MSKKPQESPLELAKKYAIPAAIAIAIPVLGFFLGFVFLFVLLIGAAAAFAFKPLSTPRVTKEFNNRKFSHLKIDDEYDYIVVGAGSAGCVLASRLAQAKNEDGSAKYNVLLIESGPNRYQDDKTKKEISGWYGLLTNVDYDYDLIVKPQPGMAGRSLQYGRGNTLGGSSAINAMMWVVGHADDYDQWADKHGAGEGWSWRALQPHFHSLETYADGPATRGRTGGISVTQVSQGAPEHAAFIQAVHSTVNVPVSADYNSGDNEGVALTQQSVTADRERCDAFTAFVEPLLGAHSNLTVVSEARVRRVVLRKDGARHRATGVIVKSGESAELFVAAKREVLLTAGAIHTPHLLMLSGIGPSADLKAAGVKVRVAAPGVGQHMIDHFAAHLPVLLKEKVAANPNAGSGLDVTAFFRSEWAKQHEASRGPDMQLVGIASPAFFRNVLPIVMVDQLLPMRNQRARHSWLGRAWRNLVPLAKAFLSLTGLLDKFSLYGYSVGLVLNHPVSRGSLRLRSANPDVQPEIDLGLLSNKLDQERVVAGARTVLKCLESKEFKPLIADYHDALKPLLKGDDKTILEYCQSNGAHAWHACGTVRMGPADDAMSPLTPDLKVKGVDGLRVADCSIMPEIVSGNTNAPAMIIGSRAAEIILDENK